MHINFKKFIYMYHMYSLLNIMNIFFLSWNPETCAQMHCDKHVVKMILETAQILCTAHRVVDESFLNGDV